MKILYSYFMLSLGISSNKKNTQNLVEGQFVSISELNSSLGSNSWSLVEPKHTSRSNLLLNRHNQFIQGLQKKKHVDAVCWWGFVIT